MIAYEPGRLLEFSWGPDRIRLEIVPHDAGCTLILTDTIEELGKAARDGAGWHTCLDMLERDLEGGAPGRHGQCVGVAPGGERHPHRVGRHRTDRLVGGSGGAGLRRHVDGECHRH